MAIGTAGLPLLTASPALADPPPGKITIDVVSDKRTCAVGTISVGIYDDNTAFTLSLGDFSVSVGGDSAPQAARKTCRLDLKVKVPAGYTFAIDEVDHHGSAKLQAGTSGHVLEEFHFQGGAVGNTIKNTVKGAHNGGWQFQNGKDTVTPVYRPCGKEPNLLIAKDLRADLGTSDATKVSSFSQGAPDGTTKYRLAWKRCTA
ncbi:DUF4360 domain-containing protein [Actinomadura graeca]|uniref:DUF4360 domain-containing protein n=1 Tax=Actinomadura graeca TaxID=2750812 RepID=A0ABX8QZ05_9ACTN|nr:DUF4360 domain-containing protein [Actinomadura graeca]QXJ23229.1 DUF4360 domain-containing protein [Actinomadura graeca]